MPALKKRVNFFESETGLRVKHILESMVEDKSYNTESGYSANSSFYPDNLIPFVDKHLNYLNAHPSLDANQYVANLRLMTRLR